MKNLSIIIPNYNGEKLLEKNVPKVIEAAKYYVKKSNSDVELIIVDDASSDQSVENLKNQISKIKSQKSKITIKLIQNSKNLGFSSTVNRGVKEAKGEVVVLLNTDVAPEKDFLFPLVKHFESKKVFTVGCMDKSMEGGKIVLRGRGVGKWKRGVLIHCRGEVNRSDTLWVSGGSGAFRKSIWEELGGFDTLYNPFYWEDIDLSYRAQKSGYIVLFEKESIVTHEHEKGSIRENYSPLKVKAIAYRNQFIFIWKNIGDQDFIRSHLLWFPYHLLTALVRLDLSFWYGLVLAILNFSIIMSKRAKLKKLYSKTDKEILNQFVSA